MGGLQAVVAFSSVNRLARRKRNARLRMGMSMSEHHVHNEWAGYMTG